MFNHVEGMIQNKSKSVSKFGKDSTGMIEYCFNDQGFRSSKNFEEVPQYAFFGCSVTFGIGVPEQLTFPYRFENSHNYGIAGGYNNHDVMKIIKQFLSSNLYHDNVKMAVVWHSRDSECLSDFYNQLKEYNIIHFFCGERLNYDNCYKMIPQIDWDVSGTHPGIQTHEKIYKVISHLLNRI